jgi:type IV secretion system protein TrbL
MTRITLFLMCFITLAMTMAPVATFGQVPETRVLDGILASYNGAVGAWGPILRTFALRLFGILAFIEFAWTAITMALNQADIKQWAAQLISRIFFIGIGFWIVQNGIPFAQNIVDSFRQAAGAASGFTTFSPSDILDEAFTIMDKVLAATSIWTPVDSVAWILCSVVIMIALAFVAAQMLLTLVEAMILINAGVFILGFLGFRWSSDIGKRYIASIIGVGAKLFMMQLIIGLGFTLIQGFVTSFTSPSIKQLMVMIGICITFAFLVQEIPDLIQGLMSGVGLGGSSGISNAAALAATGMAAAATGMVKAAALMGAAGGKTAASGGFQAVNIGGGGTQAMQIAAQGLGGALGVARGLGLTAWNAGAAMGQAGLNRAVGLPGAHFGSATGQAVEKLRAETAQLKGTGQAAGGGAPSAPYISPLNPGGANG